MESAITRAIAHEAGLLARQFRAVSIIGPRQSGKTTLARMVFKTKPYVSLENPKVQAIAGENIEAFLKQYPDGAILDEVQRLPEIFRYLQELLDNKKDRGQFILTGSNNFLLQEQISQSLAGRIGHLQLLPFSYAELSQAKQVPGQVNKLIVTGGYPEIWDQGLNPGKWMASYVQTYVQRDVRLLRNISNLGDFTRFLMLCANRAGQLLNRDEIAKNIGVDTKTIQAWLSVLESSYIIYLLQPWYNNLNKRIIKAPKLYFYDTGLLCYLLGISSATALEKHHLYGSIFENWIITEIKKNRFNAGINEDLYFFRDSAGNEIDLLLTKNDQTIAVEIKAAKKFNTDLIRGFKYWQKNKPGSQCILVYGGEQSEEKALGIHALSWREITEI
ncbi:ATP-binding protein [Niabella hirudinis]|uniref:ATP-binding protein n=1 Tax=Niabella hirudinis TaxID=1285929 RepID=UPI003EBF8745